MAFLLHFFGWHYREGLRVVFSNAVNRTVGFLNYFSVVELARTLFAPWHRITESYGRGFEPSRFFSALAGNVISRVLGAIVRIIVIIIGVAAGIAAAAFGLAAIAAWLAAPLLIPLLLLWGILIFI
jgi:type IV secretory pathway VirB6-like protein